MRPSWTVARAALTAALAVGALPGLVGSHEPAPSRIVDAALFEHVTLATPPGQTGVGPLRLDAAGRSAGVLDTGDAFLEAGADGVAALDGRALPKVVGPATQWDWQPARYSLRGEASFYDFGTTAMRDVPRGTTIVICGNGGCIQRVVNDYGPAKRTGRIIDMYRPDFFAICGCASSSGTTTVTVRVY
ncbi:MAG TPA: hypothetical protein VHR16_10365 [Candidatus Limnocylindrales bacterium]|jgi:hypothetical protein|nr:hypothetical protein [Candidatus Limnocylindrales bacterium]